MAGYCRKRSELFTISVFLGGGVSTVILRYYSDQISSYFDLGVLHRYLIIFRILVYLLPPLLFYTAVYSLNTLLVRLFGTVGLIEQKKAILTKLVNAALSKQVVDADPADLLEEVAWTSVSKYWRPR